MGVRKFRSVEEMPGSPPRTPLDPENLRLAFGLVSFAHRLAQVECAPGVRKFRTWDDLVSWRDGVVHAAAQARRARSI